MLHLRTGTPGSCKTLSLLSELKNVTDRPVYYHGINDLVLNWIPIEDPYNFHLELPENAILVIDEVQEIFRTRTPAKAVPEALKTLETHRHRGNDIYFITQHGMLIDSHIRPLVGSHVHMKRNFGASTSWRYENNEYFDSKKPGDLAKCEKTKFAQRAEDYALYKSAETHTHSRKFHRGYFILPPLILLLLVFVYFFINLFANFGGEEVQASVATTTNSSLPNQQSDPFTEKKEFYSRSLAAQMTPEIPDVPASAPFYRQAWQVRSVPRVAGCITNAGKCTCYSQQATRFFISDSACKNYLTYGYFDHTKPDDRLAQNINDEPESSFSVPPPVKKRNIFHVP